MKTVEEKTTSIETDDKKDTQTKKQMILEASQYMLSSYRMEISDAGELMYADLETPGVFKYITEHFKSLLAFDSVKSRVLTKNEVDIALAIVKDQILGKIEDGEREEISIVPRNAVGADGTAYLDTAHRNHGVIAIKPDGTWEDNAEISEDIGFSRTKILGKIDVDTDAKLEDLHGLRNFINVKDVDLTAVLTWSIFRTILPQGDCPILLAHGERGSGKTTTTERLKWLLDPMMNRDTQSFVIPHSPEDVRIKVGSVSSQVFDNVTSFSQSMSDLLCQAVTGSADATRELYTTSDVAITSFRRGIAMSCVTVPTMREDLQTRTVLVEFSSLEGAHESKAVLDKAWYDAVPRLRGAIFCLAAEALKRYTENKRDYKGLSRLSDYTILAQYVYDILIENGLIDEKTPDFETHFKQVNDNLNRESIPDVVRFMIENDDVQELQGTATQILGKVRSMAIESSHPIGLWKGSGQWFARTLKESMPTVREYFDVSVKELKAGNEWSLVRKEKVSPEIDPLLEDEDN